MIAFEYVASTIKYAYILFYKLVTLKCDEPSFDKEHDIR